jgi:hypothetical protein
MKTLAEIVLQARLARERLAPAPDPEPEPEEPDYSSEIDEYDPADTEPFRWVHEPRL